MSTLLRILAIAGLVLVMVPSIIWYGPAGLPAQGKTLMLVGTGVWFVAAYLGFRQNPTQVALDDEHTPVA